MEYFSVYTLINQFTDLLDSLVALAQSMGVVGLRYGTDEGRRTSWNRWPENVKAVYLKLESDLGSS